MNKTEPVVILAGGFGTRLKNVLNGLPKPLADINGTPFIKLLIDQLVKNGYNNFIFSLHFKADLIINFFENLDYKNCKLRFIVEPNPLGTGGAVSYIVNKLSINDYIYVVNADSWMDLGYNQFINESKDIISLIRVKNTYRYGKVIVDDSLKIIKFSEKENTKNAGLINSGFYKLHTSTFKNYKKNVYSIENDLFPMLIVEGKLFGKIIDTNFTDIGIPSDYFNFCELNKNNVI